ncbi:MAG TPA: exosortase/archaeosortase family protein [Verrucomicrobiae bacterium]|nr:exosortase/archaeosortase family protein [Verrucomicrobiae bacterium]
MQSNQAEAKSTAGVLGEFQTEFGECWQRLPNKALFFTLLAAWLALFQFLGNSILGYVDTPSLFSWMYEAYNSPNPANDNGYCNLIPFLVLGLFWWRRKELLALPLYTWWPGFFIFVVAMITHLFGYVLQAPQISIVALFVGIYGLTGLAWGYQWLKKSFFPFFLFAFAVPLGSHGEIITFPLRMLVTYLVELVANYILGIDVIRVGTQLFNPSHTYQYDVAAACSGIRSLVAIFLLATVYGFVTFRSLWKRLFLMATAFPFAVLGNLARLLLIIVAAALGGQEAGNYVHEGGPFGIISLLPYVPAILGLLWLGSLLRGKKSSDQSAQNE